MSTFTKLTYHIVFSTKHRKPLIQPEFQQRLYEYIGGIIRAKNGKLIEIGGIEDHIHILAGLNPILPVSDTIRDLKANASKWSNETSVLNSRFEWQKGYGAFTVSHSHVKSVSRYIQNQRAHHLKKNFEDEFISLLELHEIEYNPKFLFETEYHA